MKMLLPEGQTLYSDRFLEKDSRARTQTVSPTALQSSKIKSTGKQWKELISQKPLVPSQIKASEVQIRGHRKSLVVPCLFHEISLELFSSTSQMPDTK